MADGKKQSKSRIVILFISLVVFIIAASTVSNTLWGGKPEKIEAD
jgi:flagellar basal body-associated protein FliL